MGNFSATGWLDVFIDARHR